MKEVEKLDIGVLMPILERIENECKHHFLEIGYVTRFHTHLSTDTDQDTIEYGERLYEQFRLSFKLIDVYKADVRKIEYLINTMTKLNSKYLD